MDREGNISWFLHAASAKGSVAEKFDFENALLEVFSRAHDRSRLLRLLFRNVSI